MSAHFVCAERTFRYLALPPSLPGTERPPFYLVGTHGALGGGQFSERRVTCLAEERGPIQESSSSRSAISIFDEKGSILFLLLGATRPWSPGSGHRVHVGPA